PSTCTSTPRQLTAPSSPGPTATSEPAPRTSYCRSEACGPGSSSKARRLSISSRVRLLRIPPSGAVSSSCSSRTAARAWTATSVPRGVSASWTARGSAGLSGRRTRPARSSARASLETYTGSRPLKSDSSRWLGCAPVRDRPYSEASSEYCACVNPNGASTRSATARHFIDARQTRYPGVAFAVSSVGATTTTSVPVENPRPAPSYGSRYRLQRGETDGKRTARGPSRWSGPRPCCEGIAGADAYPGAFGPAPLGADRE